jgi:uncharacterized protein (DUF924 family)
MVVSPDEIIRFWFEDIEPKAWFRKNLKFDQILRDRFLETHRSAAKAECFGWRDTAEGRLAEVIVLDQFSRNIFRGRAAAFDCDQLALVLAQEAITLGCDKSLNKLQRTFLYMPYMHSESARIHEVAVQLFTALGRDDNLEYEMKHKAIIDRFGRYPHRNELLGRVSTAEEIEFLKQPGSSF